VQVKNKFILALCFSFLFMLVEVVGGYFANRSVPPDIVIGNKIDTATVPSLNVCFLQFGHYDRCSSLAV